MAVKPKEKKNSDSNPNNIRLQDILMMGLRKWPWILLSVFICVSIAVIYLMITPSVYTRTASIRIKDDSSGNSISSGIDGFSNLGLFETNTNILDEIESLSSTDFMKSVVKRLNLDVNYSRKGAYHTEDLYGSTLPINIKFVDLDDNTSASLKAELKSNGDVVLSDFKMGPDVNDSKSLLVRLGHPVQTPVGKIIITPTQYYKPGDTMEISVSKSTVKAAALANKGHLTVTQKNEKGQVLELSVIDTSTERADDILNALIAVYNENWVDDKNQVAVSTSNFINERLNVIEGELGNVDQDISSFKSEHLIPDVNQASTLYMQQNNRTEDQLVILGTKLEMTKYMKSYLANMANKNQALPTNVGIDNPTIETQILEYNKRLLDYNSAISNSSAKNPVVADMEDQLRALRGAIAAAVDNHIINLTRQINGLEQSEQQTTSKIAANPTQAKYLLSVERQQKVKESLYLFLLQKREENELSQAFTAYNTRVVDEPDGPDWPTAPVKKRVIMIAFVIGLIIPFGIIYLKEVNNTKVRGRKDVESLTVPFLGEIPQDKSKDNDDKSKGDEKTRIVVKGGQRDVMNEAFRVLRTNLGFMTSGDAGHNAIMVTSFNPASGKSFLTMNLAVSLAIKGKKVLVIDGDLRHASASKYVGSPSTGISNYLVGAVQNINDVIVKGTIQHDLDVLPVGKVPPNPTELLESPKFRELIENMKGEYDYVFLDCPPVEMMADAQIVGSIVDRTIFIVRAGLLDRSMLPELEKYYNEKKFPNMSFILNGTANAGRRYGYKYGYGYGYGYGYEYGEDKKKKKK